MPADGPSFGVAPSGTWIWISQFSKAEKSILKDEQLDLRYWSAIVALSFITLPRLPVIDIFPFPLLKIDSINKISPPTFVHAKPVTTPGISKSSDLLLWYFGGPRIISISDKFGDLIYDWSVAIDLATYLVTFAITFSKVLTPDSLV